MGYFTESNQKRDVNQIFEPFHPIFGILLVSLNEFSIDL